MKLLMMSGQKFLTFHKKKGNVYMRYIHICKNVDQIGSNKLWEGRLKEIKDNIKRV